MTSRPLRTDLALFLSLLLMGLSVYEGLRAASDPVAIWFTTTVLDLAAAVEHPLRREPFALHLGLACCGVLVSYVLLLLSSRMIEAHGRRPPEQVERRSG